MTKIQIQKVISKALEKAMVGKEHRTEHKRHFVEPTLPLIERCSKCKRHLTEPTSPLVEVVLHLLELTAYEISRQAYQ